MHSVPFLSGGLYGIEFNTVFQCEITVVEIRRIVMVFSNKNKRRALIQQKT